MAAILIPVGTSEAPQSLPFDTRGWNSKASRSEILSAIGGSAFSPLFSAPVGDRGTVYWISTFQDDVNERAARLCCINDIRGDAVLVVGGDTDGAPSTQELHSLMSKLSSVRLPRRRRRGEHSPDKCRCQLECQLDRGKEEKGEGDDQVVPWLGCEERDREGEEEGSETLEFSENGEKAAKRRELCAACADIRASSAGISKSGRGSPLHHKLTTYRSQDLEVFDPPRRQLKFEDDASSATPSDSSSRGRPCSPDSELEAGFRSLDLKALDNSAALNSDSSQPLNPPATRREGVSAATAQRSGDVLPLESLLHIFSALSFRELHACARVNRRWRQAVLEEEELLANAPITRKATLPDVTKQSQSRSDSGRLSTLQWMHPALRMKICNSHIPLILVQAAEAGNPEAMAWYADCLESQGAMQLRKALEWRKKAARKGHQACQYLVGMAFYRGAGDAARDPEEALAWLLRCVKNPDSQAHICAAAALLLGYMYLDGEGTERADVSESIKWLKIARDLGCKEAEETVGWLWNTGQY